MILLFPMLNAVGADIDSSYILVHGKFLYNFINFNLKKKLGL